MKIEREKWREGGREAKIKHNEYIFLSYQPVWYE